MIADKRVEYTLYLNKQLSKNADRIQVEKQAFEKLNSNYKGIADLFSGEFETKLDLISKEDAIAKKLEEQQKVADETGVPVQNQANTENETELQNQKKVDSYRI